MVNPNSPWPLYFIFKVYFGLILFSYQKNNIIFYFLCEKLKIEILDIRSATLNIMIDYGVFGNRQRTCRYKVKFKRTYISICIKKSHPGKLTF